MNKFSERLQELRKEKGLSRKQLSQVFFVSERLISYWENGQRECSFEQLIAIAKYFNVSTDYLLGVVNF